MFINIKYANYNEKSINNLVFCLLLSFTLLACSTNSHEAVIRKNIDKFKIAQTARNNGKTTINNSSFAEEISYLGSWPPNKGLSLSGGGARSASFSIGVLKALHEAGLLNKMDVISTVSGGSYAAYWYYSKEFYQSLVEKYAGTEQHYKIDDIFRRRVDKVDEKHPTNLDDPNIYRFQKYLEDSSEIMKWDHADSLTSEIADYLALITQGGIQILSTPIHWLVNGVFDTELNITPVFYFYKDGLDRTYGYVPLDSSNKHFANARSNTINVEEIDAVPITSNDIKDFFKKKKSKSEHLPYLIINTTARYGRSMNQYLGEERSMESSTFEFTPWGCHSALLKLTTCPKDFNIFPQDFTATDIDLARQVAFSGAAVDGQVPGVPWAGKIGLDILNADLGHHVTNPEANDFHYWIHKFLPWPLYSLDDALFWDKNDATSLYLSDGGHSENLGALALIRRGVKNIIIVDAEQDEYSTFEAAKLLKNTLEKHGMDFKLDGRPIDVFDTPIDQAVMTGSIKCIDRSEECLDVIKTPEIKVTYIKLSIDSTEVSKNSTKIPFSVRSYKQAHPDFPHEPTADIFYSAEQFKAYRDLGYIIACSYYKSCKNF